MLIKRNYYDNLFDTVFNNTNGLHDLFRAPAIQWPSISTKEHDDQLEVSVEVPGFTADQLQISIHKGVLSLMAKNDKKSCSRSWSLPVEVKTEGAEAKLQHGILTILLPKADAERAITIPVTCAQIV